MGAAGVGSRGVGGRGVDSRGAGWFDWSANPYRGCEFGCGHCYARYTHEFLGRGLSKDLDPKDFERHPVVKRGFADALARDLRRVRPGEHVAFGTATDPYQPVERREGVMHDALEVLAQHRGLRISITTKSPLVTRDIALLTRIASRHALQVNVTITTPDERLARFLEPRAAPPDRRIAAMRRLHRAGVETGLFLMPVLPGVTDLDADYARLFQSAERAGASWVAANVVFLREPSRSHFLRQLRRAYPRVAARYGLWTRHRAQLPSRVRVEVRDRIARLARDARLPLLGEDAPPAPAPDPQAVFAFAVAGGSADGPADGTFEPERE